MTIFTEAEHYHKWAQQIDEFVASNSYDAIVNACDDDEAGDLKFVYTIEALGLEAYPTRRLHICAYTDEVLTSEILSLSND